MDEDAADLTGRVGEDAADLAGRAAAGPAGAARTDEPAGAPSAPPLGPAGGTAGRRVRTVAATGAVAALVAAVLTTLPSAGQGDGLVVGEAPAPAPDGPAADARHGDDVRAPRGLDGRVAVQLAAGRALGPGDASLPEGVEAFYRSAAERVRAERAGCAVDWTLLAGIGRVESDHARGGGGPGWDGTARPGIFGPRLDGSLAGTMTITDSDGGRLDGDPLFDRAVGPMQFLPGTWAGSGRDGDGDGDRDPQSLPDAAAAAGHYLCDVGADLATEAGRRTALFRYNRSVEYADLVLRWADLYAGRPVPPPVAPGDPAAAAPAVPDDAPAPASATVVLPPAPAAPSAAPLPSGTSAAVAEGADGPGPADHPTGPARPVPPRTDGADEPPSDDGPTSPDAPGPGTADRPDPADPAGPDAPPPTESTWQVRWADGTWSPARWACGETALDASTLVELSDAVCSSPDELTLLVDRADEQPVALRPSEQDEPVDLQPGDDAAYLEVDGLDVRVLLQVADLPDGGPEAAVAG